MLALEFFTWWYGRGWSQLIHNMGLRILKVSHMFSAPILIRTLFAPWRRIVTYPGATLEARIRAMGDNFVSRMVGFTVRAFVLFTAGLMLLFTAIISGFEIAVWPLLPLSIPVAVVLGIIG